MKAKLKKESLNLTFCLDITMESDSHVSKFLKLCPPKYKRSTVEAILNCLSLCSNTGVGQDKNFGQVDCKKCYYKCKDGNNIEVRCKQCQTESQQTAVAKSSNVCSKCKRRKLACTLGKCTSKLCSKNKSVSKVSDEKGMLCKKCKAVCEDGKKKLICKQCKQPITEDKNVATENPPPEYKELNPKMLNKLDCKICGFETQIDGTKDFVCYPCVDKAKKKLCAPPKESKSDGGKADCGKADGGKADCGKADGGKADGGKADCGKADGGKADGGMADGGKADGGMADGGKAKTKDLYPCEQCGLKVTKEKCHNVLRLVCDRCAGGGTLNVSNITPYSVDLSWAKPEKEPEKYLIQVNGPDGNWQTVQTLPGDLDPTRTTVSGLTPEVPYAFRVIAVDKNNEESPPLTSDIITTPAGDEKLRVSDITPHSAALSWDKPEEEPDNYHIEKQENAPDGSWSPVKTVPGNIDPNKVPVTDLKADTPYKFRVIPEKGGANGTPLVSRQITTSGGDGDEKLRVSDITPQSAALSWDKPEKEPDKYHIEKQENAPGGSWSPVKTVPGNIDPNKVPVTDLKADTPYRFRVIPEKGGAKDTPLVSKQITTSGGDGDEKLRVSDITPHSAAVSWDKPENAPDKYHIEKQENAPDGRWSPVKTVPGNIGPNKVPITDLKADTPYKFRVIPEKGGAKDTPLVSKQITTSGGDGDEKLRVSDITPHSAAISWDKPEKAPDKYHIEKQENAPDGRWSPVKTVPGNIGPNKVPVTDLKGDTPYRFRVIPEKGGAKGTPLVSKQITTSGGDGDEKLRVSDITPQSAALSWDKPEKAPDKYHIEKQENAPGGSWSPVKTVPGNIGPNKVPVTDLKANTPYKFRVIPEKGGAKDTPLVSRQITTPGGRDGAPQTPRGPLGVSDLTPVSAVLNWKHPPTTGGTPESYEVEKQLLPDGPWHPVTSVPYNPDAAPKAVVNDLEPETPYKFRVRAKNPKDFSPFLETVNPIETLPLQDPRGSRMRKPPNPLEPPLDVTDINPKGFTLGWNPPRKGPRPDAYIIDKQTLPDGPWTPVAEVPANVTSREINDLVEGDYKYRVAAANKTGKSEPTESEPIHIPEREPSDLELSSSGLPRTWSQSVYEPEKSKVKKKKKKKSRARSRPSSRGGRGGRSQAGSRGRPPSGGKRPPSRPAE